MGRGFVRPFRLGSTATSPSASSGYLVEGGSLSHNFYSILCMLFYESSHFSELIEFFAQEDRTRLAEDDEHGAMGFFLGSFVSDGMDRKTRPG